MPTTTGDNCVITEGTGTSIATDYVTIDGAAAHVQRVKPAWGAAGSALDVSAAAPLPVTVYNPNATVSDGVTQVTSGGNARVALAGSTVVKQVVVTALSTNTSTVVVGGSTCVAAAGTQASPTRRGLPLNPGDSVAMDVTNLSAVYVGVVTQNDGVSWMALA